MVADSSRREEFRFGLGHRALEFIATLGRRHGEHHERLQQPTDLARWLEEAGRTAGISCGAGTLEEARTLREAIYRLIEAARQQQRLERDDLELLNRWARRRPPAPQLAANLSLSWTSTDPAHAALAELATSAVELLSGPDLTRIRNCANSTCSLLFIDHSRPGRRRWCSMQTCGNRDKTARYRQRRARPFDQPDRHRRETSSG